MGNNNSYPIFCKYLDLHEEQKRTIERYFYNGTSSRDGCGPLERVSDNVYRIVFRNKKDQQAVLKKSRHVVDLADGRRLGFTVRSTLEAAMTSFNTMSIALPMNLKLHTVLNAPPRGTEQKYKRLMAEIEVASTLTLYICQSKSRDLIRRKAWKATEEVDYSSPGKRCKEIVAVKSKLNENLVITNPSEESTAASYDLLNGLKVIVCFGDITTLDPDTMVNIGTEDLEHPVGASYLSETFRSKSLTVPFHCSGVFGVPLNVCSEAILNAVNEFSSQGGRSVSRIFLIDERRHVVRAMEEACDKLLRGRNDKDGALRGGEFQLGIADQVTVRQNNPGVAGGGVHVEIVLGTIESQQVDAVVSPMAGHNPLASGVGTALHQIVGSQLLSSFQREAGEESMPGDSVLLGRLPGLSSGAVFFLNLVPWDHDEDGTAVQVLRLGINNILTSCASRGFESIALPVLGGGMILRFPESVVAKVLMEEIRSFEQSRGSTKPLLVRIVLLPNEASSQCSRNIENQLQQLFTTLDKTAKKAKGKYPESASVNVWIKLTGIPDTSVSDGLFGSILVVLQVAKGAGEDNVGEENEATKRGEARRDENSEGRHYEGGLCPVLAVAGAMIAGAWASTGIGRALNSVVAGIKKAVSKIAQRKEIGGGSTDASGEASVGSGFTGGENGAGIAGGNRRVPAGGSDAGGEGPTSGISGTGGTDGAGGATGSGGTGGATGSGGTEGAGGATGSGGTEGAGRATGSGGTEGAGGATGSGGTGGATGGGTGGAGGATGSGGTVGATGSGGTEGAGGATGSGGTEGATGRATGGAGGATVSGGTVGAGGATGSGGTEGAGGATGSGGTEGAGGATGNGGTEGAGGATGSGGTEGAGGATGNRGTAGAGGATGSGGTAGAGGATGSGGTGGGTGVGACGAGGAVSEAAEGFIAAEAAAAIPGTEVAAEQVLVALGLLAPGGLYAFKKTIETIMWAAGIISQISNFVNNIKQHSRKILLVVVFYLLLLVSLFLSVNTEILVLLGVLFSFSLLVLLVMLLHNNTKEDSAPDLG